MDYAERAVSMVTRPRFAMSLPFLPGNSFDKNIGRDKFHKSHAFDYRADVPVVENKPGIGGERIPGQDLQKNTSVYPKGITGDKPPWVAFDRQVLRFHAYFQEAVHEKREERFRIRRCTLLFYLEDDSIQVNETLEENSGIPQGTLIRRHRVPLPPPNDHKCYTVEDINVGKRLPLYAKVFHITDCDQFTRNFLSKLGVKVPPGEASPSNPYSQYRNDIKRAMQPHRPYEKIDTLQQFLEHDRQVLRFFCHWDDSGSMFGDPRDLVLHYFLADDTIELLEDVPPNSGREALPLFLNRCRLSKGTIALPQPGVLTKRTVLNVFGPMGHGGRMTLDSLRTGAVATPCYHESDLAIGAVLNVWGRKLTICDCDEFTKEYYKTKYGVESFEPVKVPRPQAPVVTPKAPPYNGFGSERDSLANCLSLIPKPPRKDFVKFMEKDRQGLDSQVLRFVAALDTSRPVDTDRRFIIFYYLSDDTIAIYEPPQRNSGIIGGKFLERGSIAKPRPQGEGEGEGEGGPTIHYQAEDLYVGSCVEFLKHKFVLIDADEYALRYMEKHCDEFPHANISLIMTKLCGPASAHIDAVRKAFVEADTSKCGRLPYRQFKELVQGLSRGLLNEHETLTLGRHYGERKRPPLLSLLRITHGDLSRASYAGLEGLRAALASCDASGHGLISPQQVRNTCTDVGLPLSSQLVDGTIMNCESDAEGNIKYEQFVQFLDWKNMKLQDKADQLSMAPAGSTGSWTGFGENRETVTSVDYTALLADLTK